jgi:PAS domain S-box-containing protein
MAYIVIDRQHRVNEWNPAAEHIFGYTKQEALGKNCLDLLLPSPVGKHVQEVVRRVWKGDLNAHSVNENLTKDGRTITCEWSNTPVCDPRGKVTSIICLGRDVTASKSAEQMLESTQRRYQAIFQNTCGAIFLWDDVGHLVDGNPSACELTGFSREELVTLHVFDLMPKADRGKVSGVLQDFRSLGTMSGEGLLLRKDGETRNVEFRAVADILDGLHLSVLWDVTESRRVKEELKLHAGILQTVFDHIPVMIKFVDRNRRLQFVNQHFDKILNWSEAKSQSRHPASEFGPAENFPPRRLQQDEPIVAAHSTTKTTFKTKSSDGRMLDISWVNVTLSNGSSIGFGQDVTERTQSEALLIESTSRLRELSRRLVEEQEQERRHLARELHDEIGQVLSTIRLNLSSNLDGSSCGTRAQLEESVSIVDKAIQQVHDLSLDLRPSMIDDLGLVATLRWCAERQAERANFKLNFVAESTGERLPADLEIACYRVAQEALTNIVRHARARNVSFEFRQRQNKITIVICDDGLGFDAPAVRQRIARGASFGVRGMQERAELLGGKFVITPALGTGTTIHVQIPFEH